MRRRDRGWPLARLLEIPPGLACGDAGTETPGRRPYEAFCACVRGPPAPARCHCHGHHRATAALPSSGAASAPARRGRAPASPCACDDPRRRPPLGGAAGGPARASRPRRIAARLGATVVPCPPAWAWAWAPGRPAVACARAGLGKSPGGARSRRPVTASCVPP